MSVCWAIEPEDLLDTYKTPLALEGATWRPGLPPRSWPLYHPSEADPEAGYRPHPYTVCFSLDQPVPAYTLELDYLVIAPRLAHLELELNGIPGTVYLRPQPSRSRDIRVHAGLHTSIYAEGRALLRLPGHLFQPGENRLILTARDGGEVLLIDSTERIGRLDRMANGAGFIYQQLLLREDEPDEGLAHEVVPSVVYVRDGEGLRERSTLYLEFGGPVRGGCLRLELAGEEIAFDLPPLNFGHRRLPFTLADGDGEVSYRLRGEINERPVEESGSFSRRRKWTVYVTPHAHTDIGYTHRQWEVAERLCRNLDRALALMGERGEGMAYHLDSAWALETYLQTRDEAVRRRLLDEVRAGRLGIPSSYVDMLTHFAALEDLIRNGEFSETVVRPAGLTADFTSAVDVASLTSALPSVLHGSGVRYLVHANNQDRGPFRLNGGLHRHSPFYWEGPDGARVLVWLSKMYCELRKVCGSPPLPDAAERGLQLWLDEFERPEYLPDAVLLYGQEADNTDLDAQPLDFVARWNQEVAYPRLVPCAVSAFFQAVERAYGPQLPVFRGDGGAYWEDGVGSHLASSVAVRQAQADLPAAETLEALAVLHQPGTAYPLAQFDAAWREVLLFDEHTWGAFLSGTDPNALLQEDQWATKEHMARRAGQLSRQLLHQAAVRHGLRWNNQGREVVVWNPHSWASGGRVQVEIARDEEVVGNGGQALPQREVRHTAGQQVVELAIEPIPGLSYRRFPLRSAEHSSIEEPLRGTVLENDRYRLELDPAAGCVRSWWDKQLGRELADPASGGFGRFLYARGGEGTRLMSNRRDLPDGNPEILDGFTLREQEARVGALGQRITLHGVVEGGTLDVEWFLPAREAEVEVSFTYHKEERREKEAVYIAFPLALPGARVRSDAQLGWVDWQRERLPGACLEWLPLQTGILAEGEVSVLIASPDVPLFCVGDIVRGRWPAEANLTGGHIFSYVLNNYWHTNYRASQGGDLHFRYRLTSARALSDDQAARFGWSARRPLYAHRLSFQDFRQEHAPYDEPGGGTLARIEPETVALSTLKRARWDAGLILRLRNLTVQPQTASISVPGVTAAWECSLLERDVAPLVVEADGSVRVQLAPAGLATVRLVTEGE